MKKNPRIFVNTPEEYLEKYQQNRDNLPFLRFNEVEEDTAQTEITIARAQQLGYHDVIAFLLVFTTVGDETISEKDYKSVLEAKDSNYFNLLLSQFYAIGVVVPFDLNKTLELLESYSKDVQSIAFANIFLMIKFIEGNDSETIKNEWTKYGIDNNIPEAHVFRITEATDKQDFEKFVEYAEEGIEKRNLYAAFSLGMYYMAGIEENYASSEQALECFELALEIAKEEGDEGIIYFIEQIIAFMNEPSGEADA